MSSRSKESKEMMVIVSIPHTEEIEGKKLAEEAMIGGGRRRRRWWWFFGGGCWWV
ncbi:hypothetical protein Hanom_Chr12g01096371 [Helianthus anomalus]